MSSQLEPFVQYSDEPVYNIQAVAEQTDVAALTLRAWERRYEIPRPKRDTQGHRLYSERDVMIIRWLKHQVESSMRIKQAVKLLYSQAPQALYSNNHYVPPIHDNSLGSRYEKLAEELFEAIKNFDYSRSQMVLTHTLSLYSIEDVCLGVLVPVFQLIDQGYQDGSITLHNEHFGSNLIRERLLGILTTPATPHRNGRIVVGCAPHEWHEIGALMFSLFLRRRGWEVIYLGQNVGFAGLAETISHLRPDVFVLSIAHLPNVRYLEKVAQITYEATPKQGVFAYAGRIFLHLPQMIGNFPGVYLGDNLLTAVETIEQILNERWRVPPQREINRTPELTSALRYIEEQRGILEGAVATILNRLLGSEAETSRLAHELIDTLTIALQYNSPPILEMLYDPHNATLVSYGMEYGYLGAFVNEMTSYLQENHPAEIANTLANFLSHLSPNNLR